eukprot:CAMPEP_0117649806 /NCGR_PEP_ID=MMETSP0804-20121206/1192_1 /TAXON_ID=1074897 /ORGANISM="Tetraselmis astigmatica, Strain CCMP880" /LENGTH=957 /DNA_ID=CAMNT_0005455615 /DNA_START=144 /DNA_END=3017 /DNA_ORIENTATION=-
MATLRRGSSRRSGWPLAAVVLTVCALHGAVALVPSLSFATGSFSVHPCASDSTKCDSSRTATLTSYYGKSRSVSITASVTWGGSGDADKSFCHCRMRANMYGFDDPFLSSFNPMTTGSRSAQGGALTDSALEPWGQDWYRCWDQNSDTAPATTATTNSLTITGPSDAPFVNLPDGYYHFSMGCTDDAGSTFGTSDIFFKIDNVAPETSITPYVAPTTSSLTGFTGTRPSYDPAASDHRLRYKKTSSTNPTNAIPTRLFDFMLSVTDYHGSANADVSPSNPYSTPITSNNTLGTMSDGTTFFAEYEAITYYCKIDTSSWTDCVNYGTMFTSSSYGHFYYSASSTSSYSGVSAGNRFITTPQLSTGTHVLMVKAQDLAGNWELPTMYSFYVAPHTKGGFNSGCTFGYKLTSDNSAASYSMTDYDLSATTSVEFEDLSDGDHTLTVYAKDEFGHETASGNRQSVTWTVDRTGPVPEFTDSWTLRDTARDSSYVANSGSASLTSAYYAWAYQNTSTLALPIYSRYSIDGQTYTMDGFTTTTASSSDGFSSLAMPPFSHTFPTNSFAVGAHTVKVLGVDYVGNKGDPASDTFTVEELDTFLNCDNCAICDWSADAGCHNCQDLSTAYVSDSITFDIGAMKDGSSIKFKYDYIFSGNPSSDDYKKGEHIPEFTVRNIGEGKYYVQAKGRTLGGTYDNTPACVMVSTDTTKPVTTINSDLKRINNLARMPSKVAGTIMDLNWKYDGSTWKVMQMGSSTPLASATSSKATTGATAKMLVTASATDPNMAVWELDLSDLVSSNTMGEGQYMLVISTMDKAGHKGKEAMYDWMIDIGPPDTHIVNGPSHTTAATQVKLTFACEESGDISFCSYKWRLRPTDTFQDADCNLDKYCRVAIPADAGVNTIEVKAVDLAGNVDESSQYYTWCTLTEAQFGAFKNLTMFETPWGDKPVSFDEPSKDTIQVKS